MDVRFKVPSNFYISGQSQCGKSYLVRRLLVVMYRLGIEPNTRQPTPAWTPRDIHAAINAK